MVQVANIILDTKKTGVSSNKIIELRVCDNTDQIVAQILLNGQPRTDITSATFFAEKPDKSIIANDPANIDGSFVSYSIPKELTAVSGHITKAYFYINGTLSTDNFEILIEESVDVNGDPIDYIPGLAGLQKIWDTTKDNWEAKIKDISTGIDSFDTDEAVKDSINKAIEKAKNDSMATLDQAIKDLNDKKNEAETTGTDLDTEVTKLKAKIVDVDSLITDTQAQILAANDSFTKDQQTKVDTAISTMTSSMESAQTDINGIKDKVANIQTAVDALDIPKINADTATALKNSKDAKDAVANKIDGATLNGSDVAVKDGKLDIKVADPDMSEYATNDSVDTKLGDYSKSVDIAKDYAKKGDIPANALTVWKGSADDYAALTDKADNTEYNIVDDTGIKNIYVGDSEIYKRGIPEGTVLYDSKIYWKNGGNITGLPSNVAGLTYANTDNIDGVQKGLRIDFCSFIPTNSSSYPGAKFMGAFLSNRSSPILERMGTGEIGDDYIIYNPIFLDINSLKPFIYNNGTLSSDRNRIPIWTNSVTSQVQQVYKGLGGQSEPYYWLNSSTTVNLYINVSWDKSGFKFAPEFTFTNKVLQDLNTGNKVSVYNPLIQRIIAV